MGQKSVDIISKNCAFCGNLFEYKNNKNNKNRKYCSRKCSNMVTNKGKNIGKVRSEEWKEWAREFFKGKKNPFYGKKHTKESIEKFSNKLKGKRCPEHVKKYFSNLYSGSGNPFYGKKHTNETRKRLKEIASSESGRRIRRFNAIKKNKFYPNYSKIGCKLFEEINTELGWNGRHAENGGEYYIEELGYWVDYYEPNLNIVIEYDGKHHGLKKVREKDLIRQNEIIKFLKCKFYRIKFNEIDYWREKIKI